MIEVVRDGGAYSLRDPLNGKIISTPTDKIKLAVCCKEFSVGDCIRNDDISDDESYTQFQDRANIDDRDVERDNDGDNNRNRERNRHQRDRKAPVHLGY